MHYRYAIIIVIALMVLSGGLIYWQTHPNDSANTTDPDVDDQALTVLGDFAAELNGSAADNAIIEQNQGVFDDLTSDIPAESVSDGLLTDDLNDIDAVGQSASDQADDQDAAENSFFETIDLNN